MSDHATLRHMVAVQALSLFPPIIRESLLASREFREAYNLTTDAQIVLSGGQISFMRSRFFNAVRRAYQLPAEPIEIRSNEGQSYIMTLEGEVGNKNIALRLGELLIRLPSFWSLSPNADDRLCGLELGLRTSNIDDEDAVIWKQRAAAGAAKDDEVDQLTEYLKLTPQEVARAISNELRAGTSRIDVLVPTRLLYYERLIGRVGPSNGLEDFAAGQWKSHISQLLAWDFKAGIGQILAISPHSSLCLGISIERNRGEELIEVYQWLAAYGDRFSQVAAVELGLSLVEQFRGLEAPILEITKAIMADDPDDEEGRLKLTASLVILADGELARLGVLRDAPPFWRRLAAIAQASVIERELVKAGVRIDEFSDWAISVRGPVFALQNLVDLRLEPRWLPDFMSPNQLKLEFIGRIYSSGMHFGSQIESDELRELVSGSGPTSAQAAMKFPMAFLPGPLEAGSVSPVLFPDNLAAALREPADALLAESALAGIVNMALMFRIESDHARFVTDALRRTKYQVNVGADSGKIFSLLSGLAVVAAVSRAPELANEVRILSRVQRRRPGVTIEADNLMRIALIAAASEVDLDNWSKIVGEWLTEIAYEDIDPATASAMQAHIRTLCELVPQLWRTCAKAEAAFAAVAGMIV